MLKKYFIYVGLISIALVFVLLDFFLNGYTRFFVKQNILIEETIITGTEDISILTVSDVAYTSSNNLFIKKLKENFNDINVGKTEKANILFSRLDLSTFNLDYSNETIIKKNDKLFIDFYEFSGEATTYFNLKEALDFVLKESEDESLYESNSFGDHSFYYNDSNRIDTVFLITLINKHVIGMEYSKNVHDDVKKILEIIKEN